MKKGIFVIKSFSGISASGIGIQSHFESLKKGLTKIKTAEFDKNSWIAPYSNEIENLFTQLEKHDRSIKQQDRSIKAAALVAQTVFSEIKNKRENIIVNFGSSRGATETWEKSHENFLKSGKTSPKSSPFTTLGNVSSSVAKHLGILSANIDHSITCGSGLQSLANSMAWLRSGMADAALFGASESSLTPFSIAQMKALGIYSEYNDDFPCKPCFNSKEKKDSMVLGEGAVACYAEMIENIKSIPENSLIIESVGLANETLSSPTSVSKNGDAMFHAMKTALSFSFYPSIPPDVIVAHSPGTINGDLSEFRAIERLFGEEMPAITSNKHIIGHTLGASGLQSLLSAYCMLRWGQFNPLPYPVFFDKTPKKIDRVMINAQGFGGNAISVIASLPKN